MTVRLRLFATAREAAGRSSDEFEVEDDARVRDSSRRPTIATDHGSRDVLSSARVWVNGDEPVAGTDTVLADGDEVAVLPSGQRRELAPPIRFITLLPFCPLVRIARRHSQAPAPLATRDRCAACDCSHRMRSLLRAPPAVHASDPLAVAQARVQEATRRADAAVAAYNSAESKYYELENDADIARRTIDRLKTQQHALAKLAQARAVIAYQGGPMLIDELVGLNTDVMDAARRATLLDRVNADSNDAIARLTQVTDDVHARERALRDDATKQKHALADLQSGERAATHAVDEAKNAEQSLREKLAAEKRLAEFVAMVTKARAAARAAAVRGRRPRQRWWWKSRWWRPGRSGHRWRRLVGVSGAGTGVVPRRLGRAPQRWPPPQGHRHVLAARHTGRRTGCRLGLLPGRSARRKRGLRPRQ